jgi:HK97 family phage portal protein
MIGRLLQRRSVENPSKSWEEWADAAESVLGYSESKTGVKVGRTKALSVPGYWRGLNLIANTVAKVPLCVYRSEDLTKAKDHPAYGLVRRRANDEENAYYFKQRLMGHALQRGNGYAYIDRGEGAAFRLKQLIPMDPDTVTPLRANGQLWYVVQVPGHGLRKLFPHEVLHIHGLGYDGLVGYDVLSVVARETLGLSIAARDYQAVYFKNGAEPSVVLETPGNVSKPTREEIAKVWNDVHQGLDRAHKVAVLSNGLTVKPFSKTARESQLLETKRFTNREMANILGIPPHKLGEDGTNSYSSLEQENQSLVDEGFDPWLCAFEHECNAKLLTEEEQQNESHYFEFVRQALVRANLSERYAAYNTALGSRPFMTRNEVRARENLPPVPGGDEFLDPLNMSGPQNAPPTKGTQEPPPADDPEDPDDDDDDGGKNDRAAEYHRQIFADAVSRMVRRLTTQARRAAKEPRTFLEFTQRLHAENRATIEAVLQPHAQYRDGDVEEWRSCLSNAVYNALTVVYDTATREQFAEAIERTATELERTLPARLIDQWNQKGGGA